MRELTPDVILSTVNVSGREFPYRTVAKELGLPFVTSILSFDNLTSRGIVPRDSHYFVWGRRMSMELLRLYPDLRADQVTITGTPQFDFHRWPDCTWTRERTLRELGLEPDDEYFLYGASVGSLAPQEPALVAQLVSRMRERHRLHRRAVVIRLHPLDTPARWTGVAQHGWRVRLSTPFAAAGVPEDRSLPTYEDYARLTSSLTHADGCINIASTISLDAAILDRPVICIDFRSEPASPPEMLYAEYDCEHYAPLVQSGGIRVACTWSELLDLLEQATLAPAAERQLRARMIEEQCGPVDGRCASRVAEALAQLAPNGGRSACGAAVEPRPELVTHA